MVETKQETTASSGLQSQLSSTKGGEQALPENTQTEMGADFSGVRVHTDNSAVEMNQELGAHAFAHGSDVYFNKGHYRYGVEGRATIVNT